MARRRSGKKIDFTRWTATNSDVNAQAAGTVGVLAITTGSVSNTLLRTRGNFLCYLDGTQSAGVRVSIGVGLIVMPGGTGTTVTSSSLTDGDAPWFWYERFTLAYEEYVASVIDATGASVFRGVIDSKAMRILRLDEEVQMVVENVTEGFSSSINLTANMRFLIGS